MIVRVLASWVVVAAALVACRGDDLHVATTVDAGAPDVSVTPATDDGGRDAGGEAAVDAASSYPFPLPPGFPVPQVPVDNPLTTEKVVLGRHLFYDTRLSGNGTQSCASCHEQARAFTDGRARAVGSTGQVHPRNSMSLANVAYAAALTWVNPVLLDLEQQAGVPLFGIDPIVELGAVGNQDAVLGRLRAEPRYPPMFAAAFPGSADPFTFANIERALASFQRTMISGGSRYDRYAYGGEPSALTAEEKRGLELFESETLECFHCHGGFNFSDAVVFGDLPRGAASFHNTGLYNLGGTGAFPAPNVGLVEFTGKPSDTGRFKAPTLRNIERTAPYMHDGSIATLEEVIEHYAAGGRTIESGPNAGVGSKNPYKSGFIVSFQIPPADKAAVVAFLRALTDEAFLTDPRLGNPWSP